MEISPANLVEIGWAIRISNHTADLVKKDCGTVHGATKVMKDQVLMDPVVGQLEPASLQHALKLLHVQQGKVERDPSLAIAPGQILH